MFGWLFGGGGKSDKRKLQKLREALRVAREKIVALKRQIAGLQAKIRSKNAEISTLKAQLAQQKRINKAQQPMLNSGVNVGTYELYRSGFTRILSITMKRQRLSTYTMPEIRGVCDEMLGLSTPTEFKGYGKR
jgi:septal ring factor EnvC (AmiA/AmiB activator)